MREGARPPGGHGPLGASYLNSLPLLRHTGPVHVISSAQQAGAAIEQIRDVAILGFDTESRPSFVKGVFYPPALVQLAGPVDVYLFRVLAPGVMPALRPVLEDPAIRKVGVAPGEDTRKLLTQCAFVPASFIDLSRIAAAAGIPGVGLRHLAARFLSQRISKSAQCSNWARRTLSEQQLQYAATDAWACREIYLRMLASGLAGGAPPEAPG